MHVGGVAVFTLPDTGFDYDRLVRLIRRRIALRPALPAAHPLGPGPHREPGLGRRRELRRDLPRAPLGPAQAGHRRPAARAGRPDHEPTARPQPAAVGDVPRRGPRERPLRDPHEDPPRDGRRGQRRRHRAGDPRRHPRAPRDPAGHLASGAGAVVDRADRRRDRRPRQPAEQRPRHGPGRASPTCAGRPAGSSGAAGGVLAMVRTVAADRAVQPAQRGDRRAAAVRARRDTRLDDYKAIRKAHGGTVNDVVLAVVAGASARPGS